MAITIGAAQVLVKPSFVGFQKAVGAEVSKTMPAAGREAGDQLTDATAESVRKGSPKVSRSAKATGAAAATAMASTGASGGEGWFISADYAMKAGSGKVTATARTVGTAASAAVASTGASGGAGFVGSATGAVRSGASAIAAAARSAFTATTAVIGRGVAAGTSFITNAAASIKAGATTLASTVRQTFTGTAAVTATAGTTAGTSFVAGMTRTLGPLAAIFGGAAVLGGGFSRLANIEDAEAKLTGLGHTSETVTHVMDNALASVSGTAFGLDEAAGVAAGLIASGIQPGEELEGVLRGVADAATIGGTSLGDMGAIYNKIAAGGKIQGEELAQLGDRGIPILQLLAEHLGVSAQEVRELAAEGEVGFDDFAAAMQGGMAGAALKSGETTRGTLKNVGAAVSRLGASIMEEIFPAIKDWGDTAITVIDEQVIPAFQSAVQWVKDNAGWLAPMAGAVATLVAAFTVYSATVKIVTAVTAAWTTVQKILNGTMLLNPIGLVVAAIVLLVGAFILAWKNSETFRNVVTAAWEGIKAAAAAVVDWFTGTALPFLQRVWDGIAAGATWLWETVLRPVWEGIKAAAAAVVSWFIETALPFLQTVWDGIAAGATWLWETVLRPVWEAIRAGFDAVVAGISWAWTTVLKPAWDAIAAAATWLWDTILQPVFGFIWAAWSAMAQLMVDMWTFVLKKAWDAIAAAAQWLWHTVLKPIFGWIQTGWTVLVTAIKWAWENYLKPAWDAVSAAAQWLWHTVLKPAFDGIKKAWEGAVNGIVDFWNTKLKPMFETLADFVTDTVVPGIQTGVDTLKTIWETVANIFREPINWIIRTVYTDGIRKVFGDVAKAIGSKAELPSISEIPEFAQGGRAGRGWAIVGEKGPELVDFRSPSRVYTAAQTATALGAGEGSEGSGGGGLRGVVEAVTGWVRGGLAAAAGLILDPLKDLIGATVSRWGAFGGLAGDAATNAIDNLLGWIRGKDAEVDPETGGPLAMSGGWVRPSRGGITQRFGVAGVLSGLAHAGIDIGGGGATFAAAAGKVIRTGWNILGGRSGIGILLQHAKDLFTYYGHNPVGGVRVKTGDQVTAGQRIGAQGKTGNVTGTHLHFELHRGGIGRAVNPMQMGVFDDGGWLRPGMLGANIGRRPEPVLTAGQWADIHALAVGRNTLPPYVNLLDEDGAVMARMRVVADGRIGASEARKTRVGRVSR